MVSRTAVLISLVDNFLLHTVDHTTTGAISPTMELLINFIPIKAKDLIESVAQTFYV